MLNKKIYVVSFNWVSHPLNFNSKNMKQYPRPRQWAGKAEQIMQPSGLRSSIPDFDFPKWQPQHHEARSEKCRQLCQFKFGCCSYLTLSNVTLALVRHKIVFNIMEYVSKVFISTVGGANETLMLIEKEWSVALTSFKSIFSYLC